MIKLFNLILGFNYRRFSHRDLMILLGHFRGRTAGILIKTTAISWWILLWSFFYGENCVYSPSKFEFVSFFVCFLWQNVLHCDSTLSCDINMTICDTKVWDVWVWCDSFHSSLKFFISSLFINIDLSITSHQLTSGQWCRWNLSFHKLFVFCKSVEFFFVQLSPY